jgi:hypothetical protein
MPRNFKNRAVEAIIASSDIYCSTWPDEEERKRILVRIRRDYGIPY